MPDQPPATRSCPLCKEDVRSDAVRCKHCQGTIPLAAPTHDGVCPYCKEAINPAAIRCMHCAANLDGPLRRASGSVAQMRLRRSAAAVSGGGGADVRPACGISTDGPAVSCPPTVLSSDPEGHGLGVWVLIEATDHDCVYEYAGGIA